MEYNKNDDVDPTLLSHPLFFYFFFFFFGIEVFFLSTTSRKKANCSILK